jgi:hypothetical protein
VNVAQNLKCGVFCEKGVLLIFWPCCACGSHSSNSEPSPSITHTTVVLVFIFVEEINQRKYFTTKLKISLYHFDDTQSLHLEPNVTSIIFLGNLLFALPFTTLLTSTPTNNNVVRRRCRCFLFLVSCCFANHQPQNP